MTVAELQAAVPGAALEDSHKWLTSKGYRLPFAAPPDVKLYAVVDGDHVRDLEVVVDGTDAKSRIVAAWGQPDAEPGRQYDDPTWRSVEAGWRAELLCDPAGTQDPGCMLVLHRHRPIDDMFAALAPPAPFDQLRIDMPEAESRRLTGLPLPHNSWFKPLDYDGAEADITAVKGYLREISFTMPASARDVIVQKWGAPRATKDEYQIWIDDKAGWSAYVDSFGKDEIKVSFANVVPVTTVVDALVAMAGRTKSEIRADHPEMTDERDWLAMPSIDLAARPGDYDTDGPGRGSGRPRRASRSCSTPSTWCPAPVTPCSPSSPSTTASSPKPGRDKDNEKILVYSPHLSVGVDKQRAKFFVEVK